MKATLKVLALLLIAVMMIGMFAGCQQPTPPTTTAKPNEGNEGTTEKTLEPKTLTLMVDASSYDSFDFQRFVDGETNIYPWFMEALKEKNLTIKFEIIQHDQYDVALQTTLADPDTMPDYIWLDGGNQSLATAAATEGLFLDIQTILEYSDGTASGWHKENPAYFALTQYAGKNWWIGEYGTVFWGGEEVPVAGGCPTGMQIREDWIDILIPTPSKSWVCSCSAARKRTSTATASLVTRLCSLTLKSPAAPTASRSTSAFLRLSSFPTC